MKYVSPEYKNEVLSTNDIMDFSVNDVKVSSGTLSELGYGSGSLFEGDDENRVLTSVQNHVDISDLF